MTGADCIAKAATIDATTIDAVTPMVDRDATDATCTKTNQNAETAMVEVTAGRDAMRRQRTWNGAGKKVVEEKQR